jgi:hypothetical protein
MRPHSATLGWVACEKYSGSQARRLGGHVGLMGSLSRPNQSLGLPFSGVSFVTWEISYIYAKPMGRGLWPYPPFRKYPEFKELNSSPYPSTR